MLGRCHLAVSQLYRKEDFEVYGVTGGMGSIDNLPRLQDDGWLKHGVSRQGL